VHATAFVVLIGVALGILFLIFGNLWLQTHLGPVGPGAESIVRVPEHSGSRGVARLLKEKRLIRNDLAFRIALRQWGLSDKLKAGYYRLSPAMRAEEIARCLAEGRVAVAKITIPEGFTVPQIADRLANEQLCTAAEFLDAARPANVRNPRLRLAGGSLEGFLFPDTYTVKYGTPPADIVNLMTDNFVQRVVEGLAPDLGASRHSLNEVVTIASMIEREAEVDKDRPLIASVIYNRLRKDMRLQIDATVIYALGEHRSRLTREDLKVDSPFNTYRYQGLPPHPICNPGLPSIRAALRPANTDYLYYVARSDGSHVFTKTYEEHRKAIHEVRGNR
jgi:UPF0755 protein